MEYELWSGAAVVLDAEKHFYVAHLPTVHYVAINAAAVVRLFIASLGSWPKAMRHAQNAT